MAGSRPVTKSLWDKAAGMSGLWVKRGSSAVLRLSELPETISIVSVTLVSER